MNRATSSLLALATIASITSCELVLGLEEHTLGPIDGGTGGAVAGTAGTTDGGTAGSTTTGGTGGGGTSGTNTGGAMGGAGGDAEAGGAGGTDGGSPAMGGAGGACVLCQAELAMIHRYSFDGTGTLVEDFVGTADGTVMGGAMLTGTGTLTLPGTNSNDYVDLPDGMISVLVDATFEAWVTWNGGNNWQRVFDFGSSTMGEDMQGQSVTSIFATPRGSPTAGVGETRASFTLDGQVGEKFAAAEGALPTSVASQIVVVVDGNVLLLYVDGAIQGSVSPIGALADLDDVNNWLGHSQWAGDDEFGGIYDDFRIYNVALDEDTIAALFAAGADYQFP